MNNNDGAGGSYVVDPKTGERVLVERTDHEIKAPVIVPQKAQKQSKYKD